MALFDKTTDITQFDWNKKVGDSGKTNQDNLPANSTANKKLEDRLDEVDAIYKQNNGNNALRGANNLGFDQPFIVKDIGDDYPNIDDGIVRGGAILSVLRAGEDVVRLGKFTLTPRGILWNLKQLLLQKQNPIKESRDFNPLSTIASSAPMVHQSRNADGFNLFAEPPRYGEDAKDDDKNRLIRLKNKQEENNSGFNVKDFITGNAENPFDNPTNVVNSKEAKTFDEMESTKNPNIEIPEDDGLFKRKPYESEVTDGDKELYDLIPNNKTESDELLKSKQQDDGGIDNLNITNFTINSTASASKYGLGSGMIRVSGDSKVYSVGVSNALQVPYGGKYGDLSFATTQDNKLPKDFIKFRIRDAVNGKWLVFPAMLGTITDTVSPEYTQERYIGRPDAVHIYTGTNRNVTFDFKVAAFTKQDIPIIQEKMSYLIGLGYPHFKNYGGDEEMRPVTPYIYLTIGDLFNNTPGYFNSISCTIDETTTWELDEGYQIPQYWNVSVDFVYIGKYLPHSLSKHYEVPWLKDEGITTNKFGTFGTNNPTEGKNSRPTINGTYGWSDEILKVNNE